MSGDRAISICSPDGRLFQVEYAQEVPIKIGSTVTQEAVCGGVVVARRLSNGHVDVRICYPRDFLRSCADSPFALLPPTNIRQIVFEMSELLVSFPRRYRSPTSIFSHSRSM